MTKVKICGLSTPEAVQTAVEAGADYIGFVFAPSKRQVTLEQARELATGIPKGFKSRCFCITTKRRSGASLPSCGLGPDTSAWIDG